MDTTFPSIAKDATRRAALLLTAEGIPNGYYYTGGGCMVTYVPLGHDDVSSDDFRDRPHLGIIGDEGEWPTLESPLLGYFIVRYSDYEDSGTVVRGCAMTDAEMLDVVRKIRAEALEEYSISS